MKKNGQVMEEYLYDGDGKRIKKIDAASERIYIYSGLNVLYEVNVTTQMDAIYLYGPTGKIARKVNDITDYYHTDHLGSTRLVTSENGTVTEEIQYEPFGEQINASEERYTYNGKERDETGLYYYGARYYDPLIGRFLTRDSVSGEKEVPQTLNKYMYCLNNPLKYTDPTGNETEGKDAQDIIEEIFARMQNADPAQLAQIQAQFDSGEITALRALELIMELLGYEFIEKNGNLEVTIDKETGQFVNVILDTTLRDWGQCDGKNIYINFGKEGKTDRVADMALIALHEVCHAILGGEFGDQNYEHSIMYSVEYSYFLSFKAFLGVDFSSAYGDHLQIEVAIYDEPMTNEVPIPKIMEKWQPYLGFVIA